VNVVFDLPPEAERAGYSTVSRAVQNPAKLEALGWKAQHTLEDGMRRMLNILTEEV
jgi:nucleoside-diphosphate-sugar epimerase